jgi:hypothetical protein
MDFGDAESNEAAQELVLGPEQVKGDKVELRFVKFQNVRSLHVLVKDNQEDEETTRIDSIDVYGVCESAWGLWMGAKRGVWVKGQRADEQWARRRRRGRCPSTTTTTRVGARDVVWGGFEWSCGASRGVLRPRHRQRDPGAVEQMHFVCVFGAAPAHSAGLVALERSWDAHLGLTR